MCAEKQWRLHTRQRCSAVVSISHCLGRSRTESPSLNERTTTKSQTLLLRNPVASLINSSVTWPQNVACEIIFKSIDYSAWVQVLMQLHSTRAPISALQSGGDEVFGASAETRASSAWISTHCVGRVSCWFVPATPSLLQGQRQLSMRCS